MFAVSVSLSRGLNRRWRVQCTPRARGHSVQPLSNYFDYLLAFCVVYCVYYVLFYTDVSCASFAVPGVRLSRCSEAYLLTYLFCNSLYAVSCEMWPVGTDIAVAWLSVCLSVCLFANHWPLSVNGTWFSPNLFIKLSNVHQKLSDLSFVLCMKY